MGQGSAVCPWARVSACRGTPVRPTWHVLGGPFIPPVGVIGRARALDVAARTRHAGRVTDLPATHPYLADLDAEAQGWRHLVEIVRSLTLEQRLAPGYYVDPAWSVRDVVGHIGAWLAEAGVQ